VIHHHHRYILAAINDSGAREAVDYVGGLECPDDLPMEIGVVRISHDNPVAVIESDLDVSVSAAVVADDYGGVPAIIVGFDIGKVGVSGWEEGIHIAPLPA
jgi:hypothetical protein